MIDLKTVDFGQLKQAVKEFNNSGIIEKLGLTPLRTVGIKKEDAVRAFIKAIEIVADKGLADDLSDEITGMYNFCFSDEMDDEQKEELLLPEEDEDDIEEDEDDIEEPEEDIELDEDEDDIDEDDIEEDDEDEEEDNYLDEEDDEEESEDDEEGDEESDGKLEEEDEEPEEPEEPEDEVDKEKTKSKTKSKVDKEEKPKAKAEPKKNNGKSKFGHMLGKPTGQMDEMFEAGTTLSKITAVLGVQQKDITRHLRRLKKKGFVLTKRTSDDDSLSQIYKVSAPKK